MCPHPFDNCTPYPTHPHCLATQCYALSLLHCLHPNPITFPPFLQVAALVPLDFDLIQSSQFFLHGQAVNAVDPSSPDGILCPVNGDSSVDMCLNGSIANHKSSSTSSTPKGSAAKYSHGLKDQRSLLLHKNFVLFVSRSASSPSPPQIVHLCNLFKAQSVSQCTSCQERGDHIEFSFVSCSPGSQGPPSSCHQPIKASISIHGPILSRRTVWQAEKSAILHSIRGGVSSSGRATLSLGRARKVSMKVEKGFKQDILGLSDVNSSIQKCHLHTIKNLLFKKKTA